MKHLLVFTSLLALSTLSVYGDKKIVKVSERGQQISIISEPLPVELRYVMCSMPPLPPGENICKPHGSQDPDVDLDAAWADICSSVAKILGYAKGTCLAVESPTGSDRMYHVCGLTADLAADPQDSACAVYLTTEKLSVPVPRDQRCAQNGFKVLYERMENATGREE